MLIVFVRHIASVAQHPPLFQFDHTSLGIGYDERVSMCPQCSGFVWPHAKITIGAVFCLIPPVR